MENAKVGLFPVFLKLNGRRCLVVGAGAIAEGKTRSLLAARGDVHLVGPQATEKLRQWAREGRLVWRNRAFQVSDLEGVFLVVVATSSRLLNELVSREAARLCILCNAVDDPAHCDFYYGAVVRRGPLQIAISTSGCSPALSQRLKRRIATEFGPEYGEWVEQLGEARRRVLARPMPPKRRQQLLHRLASEEGYASFLRKRARTKKRQ